MSALRIIRVAAVASIAVLVTAVIVFSLLPPPAKQQAESVPIGGPFELVDQDGIKVTDKTSAGKPTRPSTRAYADSPEPAGKIAAVAKEYRVYYKRIQLEEGSYAMDHATVIYLMDRAGMFVTQAGDLVPIHHYLWHDGVLRRMLPGGN
jgi:cytochrome oxidase Cu insertion factor (SCO1/SenC/PrrC family)